MLKKFGSSMAWRKGWFRNARRRGVFGTI